MKQLIIMAIAGMLSASCSAIKVEEQIVQDFVKEKNLKNNPNASPAYLIEESGPSAKSLEYYQMAYADKSLPAGKKRIEVLPGSFKNWPIDENELAQLQESNKAGQSESWNSKNFNSLDIPIISRKDLEYEIARQVLPPTSSGNIISRPIVTADGKYALFYYYSFLPMSSIAKKVCLAKKVNNRWLIEAEFYDPNVFQ
ncbi:hypothetical protein LPB248_00275 [Flavobacterium sp. LPB0248]|uniref:hypothetical protein n=1 Tax=Flavobacterium sp. LPB0248 TaxID=2614441 RepID=UPI0015A50A31|nr:hypothetical protein [Flavobacterium sp. LPB0248]QLC64770.1 hypothetical protein LPB248_00275 [Flavobacterium sp. LPB0248]